MTTTVHLEWIADQHRRILGIVDGLDDRQLRTAALPSGWTTLGMLVHLRRATRFWCLKIMLDQAPDPARERDDWTSPFVVPTSSAPEEVVESFRATTREALTAVAHLRIDTVPAWWPDGEWGGWRLHTLQEVLLHLLVETACHAGHLDAARELIDGSIWDYAQGRAIRPPVLSRRTAEAGTAA